MKYPIGKINADVMIMGGDRGAIRNEHLLEMTTIFPALCSAFCRGRPLRCMLIAQVVCGDLYDLLDTPHGATTPQLITQQIK